MISELSRTEHVNQMMRECHIALARKVIGAIIWIGLAYFTYEQVSRYL